MTDRERFVVDPGTTTKKTDTPPPGSAEGEPTPAASDAMAATPVDPVEPEDIDDLGVQLAEALRNGNGGKGYQPVIVFGTSNSGKTALLLSLIAAIKSEHALETGLTLADPLLGAGDTVSEKMHEEAELTFYNRTQAFLEGKVIEKTTAPLPFFVPMLFTPRGKEQVAFAFLESNGEWYRPNRDGGRLFPKLKREIETFIRNYQGPLIFLYLLPYTQANITAERASPTDVKAVSEASLAMVGVLDAYEKIRLIGRESDQHLMLVTKWDARSQKKNLHQKIDLDVDRGEMMAFCDERYAQALASYRGLIIREDQRHIDSYCAGLMSEDGILHVRDIEARAAVLSFPTRLWKFLYRTALSNTGQSPQSPFPEPPKPLLPVRLFLALLNKIA